MSFVLLCQKSTNDPHALHSHQLRTASKSLSSSGLWCLCNFLSCTVGAFAPQPPLTAFGQAVRSATHAHLLWPHASCSHGPCHGPSSRRPAAHPHLSTSLCLGSSLSPSPTQSTGLPHFYIWKMGHSLWLYAQCPEQTSPGPHTKLELPKRRPSLPGLQVKRIIIKKKIIHLLDSKGCGKSQRHVTGSLHLWGHGQQEMGWPRALGPQRISKALSALCKGNLTYHRPRKPVY